MWWSGIHGLIIPGAETSLWVKGAEWKDLSIHHQILAFSRPRAHTSRKRHMPEIQVCAKETLLSHHLVSNDTSVDLHLWGCGWCEGGSGGVCSKPYWMDVLACVRLSSRGGMSSAEVGPAGEGRGCFYRDKRGGGDHFFPGNSSNMSCHRHFPDSSLGESERERGGRAWGWASSQGGRQPTKTADSSRSAQEGGVGGGGVSVWLCLCGCACLYVWCGCLCVWGGDAVKVLMSAPFASQCSRLLFPSQRVQRVPGEFLHYIPFPLFQECLCQDRHPWVSSVFF